MIEIDCDPSEGGEVRRAYESLADDIRESTCEPFKTALIVNGEYVDGTIRTAEDAAAERADD